MTKNVQRIDAGLTDDNGDPTTLEKKIRQSPVKSKKVKDMMRSKSTGMVLQLGGLDTSHSQLKRLIPTYQSKALQLYLLGKNEIFGMEEIVEMAHRRAFSVTCSSTYGSCYIISKEQFRDCVNHFHFSDQVIQELLLKHSLFKQRVLQTHVFQQKFSQD